MAKRWRGCPSFPNSRDRPGGLSYPKPAVSSPVSRSIAVADVSRSIAFYRDILGFDIRDQSGGIHAVCGPADIEFEPRHEPTAPAAIRARGGMPSALEKVNSIKMRMCEIRDPDGHTLWFGQSYDVPCTPAPAPMMKKALRNCRSTT